jgi:hypothetical protein
MKYKTGKGEQIVESFLVNDKPAFIITRCADRMTYVLYSIDDNNETKRICKGDNPIKLEQKSGYEKLCEKWWKENEEQD